MAKPRYESFINPSRAELLFSHSQPYSASSRAELLFSHSQPYSASSRAELDSAPRLRVKARNDPKQVVLSFPL